MFGSWQVSSMASATIAVVIGVLPTTAQAQSAAKATVQVFALEVRKPIPSLDPPPEAKDNPDGPSVNLEFGSAERTGVTVELLVTFKDEMIVDLDEKATRLTQFADDKGTQLLKVSAGKSPKMADWILSEHRSPKLSKDGRCTLKIASSQMPAIGATKLLLKGQLGFDLGKTLRTGVWTRASKKDGYFYKIGPFDFSFEDRLKSPFPDDSRDWGGNCTISSDKPNRLKRVSFFDKDSKEIKSEMTGNSAALGIKVTVTDEKGNESVTPQAPSYSWNHVFGPTYARVVLDYYETTEMVVVPFDLEIPLGF